MMNRIFSLLVIMSLVFIACNNQKKEIGNINSSDNITKKNLSQEKAWVSLFDGTSTDQWRGYLADSIYKEWTIDEGILTFTPGDKSGKNIISKQKFTNFILSLEWKISEKGNSGIFWGVYEDNQFPEAYQTGPEIQVFGHGKSLDSDDIKETHKAGSIFGMMACDPDLINPAGEWNICILKIDHENNIGSVSMNGKEAFTFPVHGEKWDAMVENPKFKEWEGFGQYQTGHIGLQDHSDKVWYRNIKIKEL